MKNSKQIYILSLFLTLIYQTITAVSAETLSQIQPKHSKLLLKGGLTHSQQVEPIESSLRAGATFNTATLKSIQQTDLWYRLPPWMSGQWKQSHNTTFFRKDLRTGVENFDTRISAFSIGRGGGKQIDRKGQIWDLASGGSNIGKADDFVNYQFVKSVEPELSTDKEVVIRFLGTMIYVDRRTNKIIQSDQVESINTYTKAGSDVLKIVSSNKTFDKDGEAIRLYKNLSYMTKTAPFQLINTWKGRDMKASFCKFLDAVDMANLKP